MKKEIKKSFYMSWDSIDTKAYDENFKNTSITVECLSIVDIEDITKATPEPQK